MKIGIRFLKVLVLLLPSMIVVLILINQFPYTGLGRILSLPLIFFLNITLISLGLIVAHQLRHRYSIFLWVLIILLTLLLTLLLYPQEHGPSVIAQLWDKLDIR
ncbi:hypothetical protein H1230_17615 [Paenibacillus sp. 19GGS1-52]|uniref:hypothetical protein n=1 Tax=Paenibacillus sp. 19GGS1-52 TaxID=2758563 RepID=UPI001EFC07FD|nr:hypothetical protein [Paenibacillus sp. 19GGS1-52]ULO04949.1 hypothetical protein H1230_17615 [Paenibacillus sp. 19GGS1-52]